MKIHNNSLLNSLPLQGKEATNKTTFFAFTLVELIVVITILAILGMIAFISLQGYSADARDSSRISDVNHIKTSLELQSLASGKYPMPDNYQDVTLSSGTIVWHQGTLGENVTKILSRNLNEKPTDPLYNTEYIYSVTPSQNQYEVMSVYEGDMVYSSPRPLGEGLGVRANASSNTLKIDGTYNGIYVKTGDYIIPTPSIITSETLPSQLNETTIKSQVINRGTNIPNIGTPKITQSTGALTFNDFEVYNGTLNQESSTGFLLAYQALANTYNGSSLAGDGVIKTLLTQTTDEQKIEFTKSLILNTVSSSSLTYNCDETTKPTDNGHIIYTTSAATSTNQAYIQDAPNCGFTCAVGYEYIELSKACIESICNGSIPTNATSTATSQNTSTSWIYNTTPGICTFTCNENYTWNGSSCIANTQTATCGGTLPTHSSATNGTTYTQTWDGSSWTPAGVVYVKDATNCGYTCIDGYTGTNCEIAPITDWRSKDPNCQINDIPVGTQVWAGCNSTLGTGIERGKKDDGTNGTIGSCYNYDGTNNTANCPIGGASMASNASAITFFNAMQPDGVNTNGDSEFNTIWGKLYTWDSLDTDNDNDIDTNDTNKVCGTGYHVPTDAEWATLENYLAGTTCRTADGWQCDGLGWKSNVSYNPDRKLAETLKIPLAGYRFTDGLAFGGRGYSADLWSSTPNSTNAYHRTLHRYNSSVNRDNVSQLYGFSVRCLKD